jgi:hypothetical protein
MVLEIPQCRLQSSGRQVTYEIFTAATISISQVLLLPKISEQEACVLDLHVLCVVPTNSRYYAPPIRVLQWPAVSQLIKKFPDFDRTRSFITIFTTSCHRSLLRATLIQSAPQFHILKMHVKIILPSTSGSPKRSLLFRFPY